MAVTTDPYTGPGEPVNGFSGTSIITRRHPQYSQWIDKWEFFYLTYYGGESYSDEHLFKYFKEGEDEFIGRQRRAYRENHSRRVVDLINSYLFKEPPVRRYESELIAKFIDNADGRGGTLDHFMKTASQLSSALGRVYIVCDRKKLPEEEATGTHADNINPLAQPYVYLILPQNMLDIGIDDYGAVTWALVRELYRPGTESFYNASQTVQYRYRLWEKGKWTLFDNDGTITDAGETGLEFVPIVYLDNEELILNPYAGLSLINDIAYLDRSIFNNWSRLDTIVCDQTFSQLTFPIEGLLNEIIDNNELRDQFMKLATNRVLFYSNQADARPEFIHPDASQAQFILDMIQVQVKQLYASIGLQAEMATETGKQSGVAKAYDFDKLNKLLANKADNLEQAENQIFKVVGEWYNVSGTSVRVNYPDEFDTRGLTDELDIAERLVLLDVSDTLMKEFNKMIAAKALPKAERETLDIINKEIDDNVDQRGEEKDKQFDVQLEAAKPQASTGAIKPGSNSGKRTEAGAKEKRSKSKANSSYERPMKDLSK